MEYSLRVPISLTEADCAIAAMTAAHERFSDIPEDTLYAMANCGEFALDAAEFLHLRDDFAAAKDAGHIHVYETTHLAIFGAFTFAHSISALPAHASHGLSITPDPARAFLARIEHVLANGEDD